MAARQWLLTLERQVGSAETKAELEQEIAEWRERITDLIADGPYIPNAEAMELCEELIDLCDDGGWPNEEALDRVKKIVFRLLGSTPEPNDYSNQKLRKAEDWAKILFSVRKHEKWTTPDGSPGAETVAHLMRSCAMIARGDIRQSYEP